MFILQPDEDKLVTSVAIPAFDNRYNREHKDDAILLGVAGTDVPIDSIAKLAQPHQVEKTSDSYNFLSLTNRRRHFVKRNSTVPPGSD